jgi:hypothetical protein
MIMTSYEGSKTYRLCNPYTSKVVVTSDTVFEENNAWQWGSNESVPIASKIFFVDYSDLEHADHEEGQPETGAEGSEEKRATPHTSSDSSCVVAPYKPAPDGHGSSSSASRPRWTEAGGLEGNVPPGCTSREKIWAYGSVSLEEPRPEVGAAASGQLTPPSSQHVFKQ